MSEQRIDHGAAAASSDDSDPSEGQGLANAASHPGGLMGGMPGDTSDAAVPHNDDLNPNTAEETPDTEGFRSIAEVTERAGGLTHP